MKKILKINLLFLFLLISSCTVTSVEPAPYVYRSQPPLQMYNGYFFQYYNPGVYGTPHYVPLPIHPPRHHHHGPRRPRR